MAHIKNNMTLEEYVTKTVLQPKSNSFNSLHFLVEQIQSGCAGENEIQQFHAGLRAREADIKQMRDEIIVIQRQIDVINQKNIEFRKNIKNPSLLQASTRLVEGASMMIDTIPQDIYIENPDVTQERLLRELELLIIKQVGLRRIVSEMKDCNQQIEKQTLDFQDSITKYRQRYQAFENLNNQQIIALGVPRQLNTQVFQAQDDKENNKQTENVIQSDVINLKDLESIHVDNFQNQTNVNATKSITTKEAEFVNNLIMRLKASSGLDMVQKVCSAHIIYHGLENQLKTSIDSAVRAQTQRALLLTSPELIFNFLVDITIDSQRQIAQIQYQQDNGNQSTNHLDVDDNKSSDDEQADDVQNKKMKYKPTKLMTQQELQQLKTKCSVSNQVVKALIQALELEQHNIMVKNSDIIAWMEYQRDKR